MEINPEVTALSMPFVSVLIDTWIKPSLINLKNEHNFNKNFERLAIEKFAEYLERAYRKQIIMNTIVFKNSQKTIDELYIPLSIESISTEIPSTIRIDKFDEKIFSKSNRILIVDNAGMGKSTLMKWLFISCIRENKGIPVFVDLRRLNGKYSLSDFITDELNGINSKIDTRYLMHILERGDFIFFFDGYDEIAVEDKTNVTIDIQNFVAKCYNNQFLMSSREEKSLSSFGDFMRFSIETLSVKDAYKLMRKYDNNGELSQELIKKLNKDGNLELLLEFLKNPLMTSLLYKAYEYKRTIPYKKHIFYRQVYNALFDEHDLSKGGSYSHEKHSMLDIEDFQRVLRNFAFLTMVKGKNSYEKEELVSYLSIAQNSNPDIKFDINAFITDCTIAVPLLIEEGIEYKWIHKSFQEYFSALYIRYDAHQLQSKILTDIMNSNNKVRYLNIMDFYYDLDYKLFQSIVIKFIAEDYLKFYNDNIEKAKFPDIKASLISERISLMYLLDLFPFIQFPNEFNVMENNNFFEKSIEKVRNHPCIKSEKNIQAALHQNIKGSTFCVYQERDLFSYIELLTKKRDLSIISPLPNQDNLGVVLDDFKCTFESEFYHIDHCSDNPFNFKENYNLTTKLIQEYLNYSDLRINESNSLYLLDIEKCKSISCSYNELPNYLDYEII